MPAALASPCRIKRSHRRVRRGASGRTVYAYVGGNPMMWIDPLGLQSRTNDWVENQRRGNPENGSLGLAGVRDALEGWFNTFRGLPEYTGNASVRIGTCVLKCGVNEFIGSSAGEVIFNAHEMAVEKAIGDAAKEAGYKCLGKAAGLYGAANTIADTVKTAGCSLECR